MKIKSYNLEFTPKEVLSLVMILGRFTDIELESKGIMGDNRELLRNMYYSLPTIDDEEI